MKILLCTSELQYSNSSAAIRNRILLTGLTQYSDVDVLEFRQTDQIDQSCDSLINKQIFVDAFLKPAPTTAAIATTASAGGWKSKLKSLLKPYIPDVFYIKPIVLDDYVNFNDYDVVISSSEPKGLHNLIIKNVEKYQVRDFQYIQYWGDPWFDDIARPTNRVTYWLERKMLNKADVIIYNSAKTLSRQKSLFKQQANKMIFVPRGIIFDKSKLPNELAFDADNMRLIYAGDYRRHCRNIQPLVDSCTNLNLSLEVAGNGELDTTNIGENVKLLGRLQTKPLSEARASANLEVVIMNTHGSQLPGKVYDVMQSDKVILIILDGDFVPSDIPCSGRFVYAKNTKEDICRVLSEIQQSSGQSNTLDFDFEQLRTVGIDELLKPVFDEVLKVKS